VEEVRAMPESEEEEGLAERDTKAALPVRVEGALKAMSGAEPAREEPPLSHN